jgi:4-methyl-5(b-hydroxyethyl)-thiazole monophosphate biosynthesis
LRAKVQIKFQNMAKVYVFLANDFEDVEALIPVDVLRRGGVEVITVSITGDSQVVESAHNVQIVADAMIEDCDFSDADLLFLPGGMPGASNLYGHEGVRQALLRQAGEGKLVAAICAAPFVLGKLGLLRGKRATCYPGFEQYLDGADYTADLLTEDGNIITGEGPGAAFDFGYALLGRLATADVVEALKEGMRYNHLMQG